MPLELTSVADDEAVFHQDGAVLRYPGLRPDTDYEMHDVAFRTLPRPPGSRLATLATVNDVHFGEVEAGMIEGLDLGPAVRVDEGEEAYPEVMNAAAIAEIAAVDPDLVVAKGDLTADGRDDEYWRFLETYQAAFGRRLLFVRGNHDAYHGQRFADASVQSVSLRGVIVALLDTVRPGHSGGQIQDQQLEWLDALAAEADRPVLLFGHHHIWNPASASRPEYYFGLRPDDSERLIEVVARRPAVIGYFAGHTHRNRVRRFSATGDVPWVEVACVKDFPGTWAEYRVFEGGVLQVHRRISTPAALRWSERCRSMIGGLYPQYAFGRLEDRCLPVWPRRAS